MLDRYTTGPLTVSSPPPQEAGPSDQVDSSLAVGLLSTSCPPVVVIVAWRVGRYNGGKLSPLSRARVMQCPENSVLAPGR
jgi:hypothetical protein